MDVAAQGVALNAKPRLAARPSNEIDWALVEHVYQSICHAGIREPKIVMAQAILETGWFRSTGLMARNNLFGFRHTSYLSFDRLEDSIEYYKAWQDANLQESETDYLRFLERIRYAAPGYTRHLKTIAWNTDCP